MSTSAYKVGTRIKNIDPRDEKGSHYGEKGTVTENDGEFVYVEYDAGGEGQSNKPEKYYQIIAYSGFKPGTTKKVSSPSYRSANTTMEGILAAVKRVGMSAEDKALVREGMMTECGMYTEKAAEIVLQELCAQNKARLVDMAAALKKDRVQSKKDENDEE